MMMPELRQDESRRCAVSATREQMGASQGARCGSKKEGRRGSAKEPRVMLSVLRDDINDETIAILE